jgi:hypothetical protein
LLFHASSENALGEYRGPVCDSVAQHRLGRQAMLDQTVGVRRHT